MSTYLSRKMALIEGTVAAHCHGDISHSPDAAEILYNCFTHVGPEGLRFACNSEVDRVPNITGSKITFPGAGERNLPHE
jgi:hypothetical protein